MRERSYYPVMATLRNARIDQGWTQLEVAAEIGASQGAVCFWENGGRPPTLRHLTRLADFLGYEITATPKESP